RSPRARVACRARTWPRCARRRSCTRWMRRDMPANRGSRGRISRRRYRRGTRDPELGRGCARGLDARRRLDAVRPPPGRERLALRQRPQLPRPQTAHEQDARVRSTEPLVRAIRDDALPHLRHRVLHADDVWRLPDVVHMQLTGEHSARQLVHRWRLAGPGALALLVRWGRLARHVHEVYVQAEVLLVVDGDAPRDGVGPTGRAVGGRSLDVEDVGHHVVGEPNAGRARRSAHKAVFGLLGGHDRNVDEAMVRERRPSVHESDVGRVDAVLDAVEIIARPNVAARRSDPTRLEVRISRERRRLPCAEIRKDEAEILLDRVAPDPNALAEGVRLRRLLDAPPVRAVAPAMVEAPDVIALDPARRKLRSAVSATEGDAVGPPAFTTIQRDVLAHDA